MPSKVKYLQYIFIATFLFLSLNRIVGGYLHLAGFSPANFHSPLFSPFGDLGTLGISPLPRAYTGLGFSDTIEIYIKSDKDDYLIDLNFTAINAQAQGHLYKYDVYLHGLFWPGKAPDIESHAGKILTYLICADQDFLRLNGVTEKPVMALIARKSVGTGDLVWKKEVLCTQ